MDNTQKVCEDSLDLLQAENAWKMLIAYLRQIEKNQIAEKLQNQSQWWTIEKVSFSRFNLNDEGSRILSKTCFFELSVINLGENQLTSIERLHQAYWPQLKDLILWDNQLTSVDKLSRANWPQLRRLVIGKNKLNNSDKLYEANWPQLKMLILSSKNQVTNVDSLNQTNWPLEVLNLIDNNFPNGAFGKKQKLKQRFQEKKLLLVPDD